MSHSTLVRQIKAFVRPPSDSADPTAELLVVPRRYPGRWVAALLVVVFLGGLIWALATAPNMQWSVVGQYLFDPSVLRGVKNTLLMTVLATAIGMTLGTLIAVMRLSQNPVLSSVAALYQWFFRGTPTLVQLIFWFNLAAIFPRIQFKIPGLEVDLDMNNLMTPLTAALLGLGLNFAAYYSEVVRAGILSVDEGQSDAAQAYALSGYQTMRHVVLPQAMRVIIPPTGNELIGMLKYTSLASIISYGELLRSVSDIYNLTYQVIPLLVVAAIWYLVITTVLTVVQYFIERRFARGASRTPPRSLLDRIPRSVHARRATR